MLKYHMQQAQHGIDYKHMHVHTHVCASSAILSITDLHAVVNKECGNTVPMLPESAAIMACNIIGPSACILIQVTCSVICCEDQTFKVVHVLKKMKINYFRFANKL